MMKKGKLELRRSVRSKQARRCQAWRGPRSDMREIARDWNNGR